MMMMRFLSRIPGSRDIYSKLHCYSVCILKCRSRVRRRTSPRTNPDEALRPGVSSVRFVRSSTSSSVILPFAPHKQRIFTSGIETPRTASNHPDDRSLHHYGGSLNRIRGTGGGTRHQDGYCKEANEEGNEGLHIL